MANIPAQRHSLLYPLAYMGLIYILSSIPDSLLPSAPQSRESVVYNTLHIPLFAVFAWLWCWSLKAWCRNKRDSFVISFCLTLGYAIFDEWHQGFIPGRHTSVMDILLDITGAAIALWVFSYMQRYKQ